jgi:hypothetical protein
MSTRAVPTSVVHFTHIANLPDIVAAGMQSDAVCRQQGLTQVEVGDLDIRERRLHVPVGVGPGGVVGDYVPFYFGPRSPMMFVLRRTDDAFKAQCDSGDIVYLATTIEHLVATGHEWVASDRNAALRIAEFVNDLSALDDHIAWQIIRAQYWTNYTDGKDLRMAELLVHGSVAWPAIQMIGVRNSAAKASVEQVLRSSEHRPEVSVRPGWYF